MKFVHLSDLHIGRTLNTLSLLEDQKYILDTIIDLCIQEKPQIVCISGDIYDKSLPSTQAVLLFSNFITSLINTCGVKVFLIPGNHDSNERLSFGNELLKTSGLYIFTRLEDAFHPVRIDDEYGEVLVYGIPFFQPLFIKGYFNSDPEIEDYNSAYKRLIREINPDPKIRSIALSHIFIRNGTQSDDSEMPLSVGGSEEVDPELFNAFSYTALGHLHRFQKPGETIVYSGSPLKYSFSEVNHEKYFVSGIIAQDGTVTLSTKQLKPLRDLQVLEGTLEELKNAAAGQVVTEDYVYIKLTDILPVFNPVTLLKPFYPNLAEIEFTKLTIKSDNAVQGPGRGMHKASMDEIFCRFYEDVTGNPISEVQKQMFTTLYNEFIAGGTV